MSQKKILIVDDEKDLREALTVALSTAGFTTYVAEDGTKAIEVAFAEKPDLILLDISMPKMNGHETLSKLRKDPWGKDVPVLFLTNHEDPSNISEGFSLKGDDYIIKSNTSLSEIVKRVKQYLGGYHD